jgi:hypothetical protein
MKQLSFVVRDFVIYSAEGQSVPVMRNDFYWWLDREARLPMQLKRDISAFFQEIDLALYKGQNISLDRLDHWHGWLGGLVFSKSHLKQEQEESIEPVFSQGPIVE